VVCLEIQASTWPVHAAGVSNFFGRRLPVFPDKVAPCQAWANAAHFLCGVSNENRQPHREVLMPSLLRDFPPR
jgi:hypothetical protein